MDRADEATELAQKLPWFYRLFVKFGVPVYIGERQQDGWSGTLPHYLIWCRFCRRFRISWPTGYEGFIDCPNFDEHP